MTPEQKEKVYDTLNELWPRLFFEGKEQKSEVVRLYMGVLEKYSFDSVMYGIRTVFKHQERPSAPTLAMLRSEVAGHDRKRRAEDVTKEVGKPCSLEQFKEDVAAGRVELKPEALEYFERRFLKKDTSKRTRRTTHVREPGEEG